MRDGTKGLLAHAPQIDQRILHHMLLEATDLLDESAEYASEGTRSTQAAMLLTRAHCVLMSVHHWISKQLEASTTTMTPLNFIDPISSIGIDDTDLSSPLAGYSIRVDRLYARVLQMRTLTDSSVEAEEAPGLREVSRVLNIFGDPDLETLAENPVLAARRKLDEKLSDPMIY